MSPETGSRSNGNQFFAFPTKTELLSASTPPLPLSGTFLKVPYMQLSTKTTGIFFFFMEVTLVVQQSVLCVIYVTNVLFLANTKAKHAH